MVGTLFSSNIDPLLIQLLSPFEFLSFVTIFFWVVTIWVFHNLCFWVLSQFEFLVLSQIEFLSFVKIWVFELCSGFPGVPLENFSSIGTWALFKFHWSSTGELVVRWSSWGCSWTLPSCATARGMSRLPNSWMRQCRESELDREFWLVEDPSQCKPTTWSDKVVVTLEQKLQPKIFAPTSSFRFNFEFNFGTILA